MSRLSARTAWLSCRITLKPSDIHSRPCEVFYGRGTLSNFIERIELIEKYMDEIRQALQGRAIYQYGERIFDPMELEFGSLCYMTSHRQNDDESMYILYIPDEADRERIKFLHECRNLLAHAACCDPGRVKKLLDKE